MNPPTKILLSLITICLTSFTFAQITGSGTVDQIAKWDSDSSLTNSQIIDDGTNVGIGTITPGTKFQVQNGVDISPLSFLGNFGLSGTDVSILSTSQSGTGMNAGVVGMSLEDDADNSGVVGIAIGNGSGAENAGLRGLAVGSEAAENIGVDGMSLGDGQDNVGVAGYAEEGTSKNIGGRFFGDHTGAPGSIKNYGIMAGAAGGAENFAGYFAYGDVVINDQLGVGTNPGGSKVIVQNGTAINLSGLLTDISVSESDVGIISTSQSTGSGVNVASLSFSSEDAGINVGSAGMATGDNALTNSGVVGNASGNNTTNGNAGLDGEAEGNNTDNYGVRGKAQSIGSNANYGVYGLAGGAPLNYGVYGNAPVGTGSYAGYFVGDAYVENLLGIGTQSPREALDVNGKAVIGTNTITAGPHTDYQLAVDGKIVTTEIICTLDNWADFVFKEEYQLKPLDELRQFISSNQRLPDMPSEKQVAEEGINLGQMNALLLQKIEELTLYILEQDRRIQEIEE